jgi:ornithine cyclodeaminase/alanine dehydrogenase-like protein (mu-crystallin family)
LLANPDARAACIFGSGAQARTQLEAVCTVRPIERIWILSLDPPTAEAMAEQARRRMPGVEVRIAESASQAAGSADVICTATTSSTPVFPDASLRSRRSYQRHRSLHPRHAGDRPGRRLRGLASSSTREGCLEPRPAT